MFLCKKKKEINARLITGITKLRELNKTESGNSYAPNSYKDI